MLIFTYELSRADFLLIKNKTELGVNVQVAQIQSKGWFIQFVFKATHTCLRHIILVNRKIENLTTSEDK